MTMQMWLMLKRAGAQAPAGSAGQAEADVVRSQGRQSTQDDGRHLRRRQWSRLRQGQGRKLTTGGHLVHLGCSKGTARTEAAVQRGRQWTGQWRMAACG